VDDQPQGIGQRTESIAPLAELILTLSDLERRLTLGLTMALSEENVTFDQWRIMEALVGLDRPTMGELAEASGMPNASLSRTVDSLEDGAFAFRLPGVADRRRITVHLSDRGVERLARVRDIVASWEKATVMMLGNDAVVALDGAARSAAQVLDGGKSLPR
jgi:DNA-binding MarR family transcriptional regulator